jgi:hypothetical protein
MTNSLGEYVDAELLIQVGFNWAEPSLMMRIGEKSYTIYLSGPREGKQTLIASSDTGEWYLRVVDDMSEEDGVGLREEEFEGVFNETITKRWKISQSQLTKKLEEILGNV